MKNINTGQLVELMRVFFCMSQEEFSTVVFPDVTDKNYLSAKFSAFTKNPASQLCELDTQRSQVLIAYGLRKVNKNTAPEA